MLIPQEKRIKITENFYLDELIHPDFYDGTIRPLKFLDNRIIEGLQIVRKKMGCPFTVNNWAAGGTRAFSGLRPFSSGIGSSLSQHKFGRAFDFVCKYSPSEVLEELKTMEGELIQSGRITRIEDPEFTTTWSHIDCAYTGQDLFKIFKP